MNNFRKTLITSQLYYKRFLSEIYFSYFEYHGVEICVVNSTTICSF